MLSIWSTSSFYSWKNKRPLCFSSQGEQDINHQRFGVPESGFANKVSIATRFVCLFGRACIRLFSGSRKKRNEFKKKKICLVDMI